MQSENVVEVGIAAVSMLDSASAEEVIVQHAAVAAAVVVVAEHIHRRDKTRNAAVECALDLGVPSPVVRNLDTQELVEQSERMENPG